MSQDSNSNQELTSEQARQKREELMRQQRERARAADERESSSEASDATVSTFILPGD